MNQIDENFKTRYGSFLLRVRQDTPGALKGKIKHVQSDDERPFAQLTDILRFIDAHLEPNEAGLEINIQDWK